VDPFVRILVAAGAALLLGTEALSPLRLLHPVPVGILWAVFAVASRTLLHRRTPNTPPAAWFDRLLWLACCAILAVAGLAAIASPPNSVDAFGYHLSRVVWWAQQGSVAFFPTHYYPQVSMPPLAEYAFLHQWLLTGGDRLANFVQWTGFAGSIAAAALLARQFGAGPRGQAIAALFVATLPNGILQASGAKNECLLALWLAAAGWFALRGEIAWLGLSLGLALATKATAWLFAPPLLAMLPGPMVLPRPRQAVRTAAIVIACVLALNGPQWWRNLSAFGSPIGPPLAHDGQSPDYRWTNRTPGLRTTLSNAARHLSQQLGGRSDAVNRAVYAAVLALHRTIRADPNDPATTWPGTDFTPPRNANHEADAPNRVHLLLLAACLPFVLLRRGRPLAWTAALATAFLLVCAVLKYQPYFARAFLPLFVLAAPVFGTLAERLRPALVQAAVCLLLLDQTRHPLLHNWTRPLTGETSILKSARDADYFRDMAQFHVGQAEYRRAADLAAANGCRAIGIDNQRFHLEYPLQVFLLRLRPPVHFTHTGVHNPTARYAPPEPEPCAVVCLGCTGNAAKMAEYAAYPPPEPVGPFLVYRRGGRSRAVTPAPAAANTASLRYTSPYPAPRSPASRARSMIPAKYPGTTNPQIPHAENSSP
jgi:hypothetical protein